MAVTGLASEKGMKAGVLLQIPSAHVSCTDPSAVKTMLPKLTTRGRGGMRFAAIDTWITVRANLAVVSGGNGGICLGQYCSCTENSESGDVLHDADHNRQDRQCGERHMMSQGDPIDSNASKKEH